MNQTELESELVARLPWAVQITDGEDFVFVEKANSDQLDTAAAWLANQIERQIQEHKVISALAELRRQRETER
jgi:hypothetical protein